MREIKFRAWNTEVKIMKQPTDNMLISSRDGYPYWQFGYDTNPMNDCVVMQFTGLLDKNGKEIYESDYLESDSGLNVWCVYWGGGKYILQNISTGDIIDCDGNNTIRQEVIGNRYQNPREHKAMASDL